MLAAETEVANGISIWNPDFDYNKPMSEMILTLHPELKMSYDETEVTMDQTADKQTTLAEKRKVMKTNSKTGQVKAVTVVENDAVSTKSSCKGSLFGGSVATGHRAWPLLVTPGSSIDVRHMDAWGTCEPIFAIAPNGSKQECTFMANGKGGSNNDVGLHFIRHNLIPTLNANALIGKDFTMGEEPAWRYDTSDDNWAQRSHVADEIMYGMEPGSRTKIDDPIQWVTPQVRPRRGLAYCDGLDHHFGMRQINELNRPTDPAMHPVDMVLRPPHTSQSTQNEGG